MNFYNVYGDMVAGFDHLCEHTSKTAEVIYQATCNATEIAYNDGCKITEAVSQEIEAQYYTLAEHVVQLTREQLGYEASEHVQNAFYVIAEVAKRSFLAAPVTAAALLLPAYVTTPLWIGYGVTHLLYENPLQTWQYNNLYTGQGNAYLIRAGKSILDFTITRDPAHAIGAVINVFFAVLWHNKLITDKSPDGGDDGEDPRVPEPIPVENPRPILEPSVLELHDDDDDTLLARRSDTPEPEDVPEARDEEPIHIEEPAAPSQPVLVAPEEKKKKTKEKEVIQPATRSRSRETATRNTPQKRSSHSKERSKGKEQSSRPVTLNRTASKIGGQTSTERPSVRHRDLPKARVLPSDESTEEMNVEDEVSVVAKKK